MIEGRIFVAAGHYPQRPGAGEDGFYEHDEAVRWVAELMRLDGASERLVEIPTGTLRQKTDFVNYRCDAARDVAVEIHFNAAVDKDGNRVGSGCVSLYMPGSTGGQELADECQTALATVFQPSRGIVAGWFRGDQSRGPFFFLAKTKCRAVILEPEFIHRKAIIQSGRDAACAALYRAWTAT